VRQPVAAYDMRSASLSNQSETLKDEICLSNVIACHYDDMMDRMMMTMTLMLESETEAR
jgi:hypothetical protein